MFGILLKIEKLDTLFSIFLEGNSSSSVDLLHILVSVCHFTVLQGPVHGAPVSHRTESRGFGFYKYYLILI
jgi:hypothetical protein